MNIYTTTLMAFQSKMSDIENRNAEWKKRIKQQFRDSMNFPRKQKKKVRKSLQLEWSIACWNPFNL